MDEAVKRNAPSREFLEKIFRTAYKIRVFETEGIKLYRQGLIRGYFHPYLGQEGIATGVCAALREGDYIASTHRGHGHCIAWGADVKRMVAELLQKETGYCRGYGGSMHIADIGKGNLGANGIVGAGTPLGVGAALAAQIRGSDAVTVTFTTDGASNNGTFLESLNLAAIWNLNFILVIENNQYAVSTPIEEATRDTDLYKRGLSIGVESHQVDGNDPLAVYHLTREAVETCRAGKGPVLIEAKTFRHMGHHVNDPGKYMPEERLAFYKARDPIDRARAALVEMSGVDKADIDAIEAEIAAEFAEAVDFAKESREITAAEFRQFVAAY
ncbi:thiamine pyrophosphate-dependent dehydrogenase E1 component subunit alpha [Aestuariivirga sp. YIM B02566]|uniref:Thiamine pyrophosphate-dependent dehydrogenase E1 component subunit alpha n=1 Tax=Taklimakanibacter albus TaxID=2800327 RepID=A0ACC5RD46_9HYPH|nr:thiamine pyrophosphate-dependent dehydrogenase E1 component subunit alpha [Aestuariivirga sp. YIM B02566]MBK1870528.1 thiamine pyrophosphate-dependent dehydrogenase E1 component subunit alpha [Aestuariivirga sp. YIM B02566]